MKTELRKPEPGEKSKWLPLWQGYLAFYESALDDEITDLTWARFHDAAESLEIIAAYVDGEMVGFATYLLHRSTWARTHYCYLEDLFVDPACRGKGVARALIERVRDIAKAQACARVYWTTKEDNATARALYDKVAKKSEFVQYRIAMVVSAVD